MKIANDLMLRVAQGLPVSRPPVWLMRQAGRYLPEYMAVRSRAGSFRAMIADPAYATEVTLQPVDLIGVDAAIIFSDILVVPEAMGLPYEMAEKTGPVFPETVRTAADLQRLQPVGPGTNLDDTLTAIRLTRAGLNGRVPLIGFAGAPWTLFCYMTEGRGSKQFSIPKGLLYRDPAFAHALLQRITDATIWYLKAQVAAGADLVQVFDSWAELLNRDMYAKFALPYLKQICDAVQEVPKIVFAKGGFFALEDLSGLDCQVLGLDWHISPEMAVKMAPGKAFQGNLDPCQLYASPAEVQRATTEMLRRFPAGRHIANLGHGLYPDIPVDSVKAMVAAVKEFSYIPA